MLTYRSTHMHSAVCCRAVSVRLSVTLVYCVVTTELIVKQLALIVVYGHQTRNIYLWGIPHRER